MCTADVPGRILTLLRRHPIAIVLSLGVLAGSLSGIPVLQTPTGDPLPAEWRLYRGAGYALFAPLVSTWDQIAMLDLGRLHGFLLGLLLGYLAWRAIAARRRRPRRVRPAREVGVLLASGACLAVFVVAGALWYQRPVARLGGLAMDELAVEVHSHTNASHDVRGGLTQGFDAAASRRWHERAGVDILFITDHNTTRGWEAHVTPAVLDGTRICPGVEISAHGAHIIVLGERLPTEAAPYRGDAAARARLLAEVAANPQAVSIASLPEYRGQVMQLVGEGVHGFEIVSASPKGNSLPRSERDSVIDLARRNHLSLVGAGDQHGIGATPMVWNVAHLPGWRAVVSAPCAELVARFRSGGPAAVTVVERTRLRPDHVLPMVFTPLGVIWLAWATASPVVAAGWLAWIWTVTLATGWWRARLDRSEPAIVQAIRPRRP